MNMVLAVGATIIMLVSLVQVTAPAAGLAGVRGGALLNRNTRNCGFVLDFLLQVKVSPGLQARSGVTALGLALPRVPDATQILKDDAAAVPFGESHDFLCDLVVDVAHGALFLVSALLEGVVLAGGLQGFACSLVFASDLFDVTATEEHALSFWVYGYCYVVLSAVNANPTDQLVL